MEARQLKRQYATSLMEARQLGHFLPVTSAVVTMQLKWKKCLQVSTPMSVGMAKVVSASAAAAEEADDAAEEDKEQDEAGGVGAS